MAFEMLTNYELDLDTEHMSKYEVHKAYNIKAQELTELFVNNGFFKNDYRDILDSADIEMDGSDPYSYDLEDADATIVLALLSAFIGDGEHSKHSLGISVGSGMPIYLEISFT